MEKSVAIFAIPELKVIDSSFIPFFLDDNIYHYSPQTRVRILRLEEALYSILPEIIQDDILIPCHVVDEKADRLPSMARGRKEPVENIRSWGRYLNDLHENLVRLIRQREDIFRKFYEKNPAEGSIPEDILRYLPSIENAIMAISRMRDVMKDYTNRGLNKRCDLGIRKSHHGNDQKIFAGCLAISFGQRVLLLTGDSDFFRMSRVFYKDPEYYSEKYGFPLPENDIDLILRYREDYFLAKPWDHHIKPIKFYREAGEYGALRVSKESLDEFLPLSL